MRRHTTPKVIEALVPVGEVLEVTSTSANPHEQALDEIISKGRQMVKSGEIKITGQTLNQAIKTKAEIEKANKDRGLDVIKMMAGAFGNSDEETSEE